MTLLLNNDDVAQLLDIKTCVQVIEEAYQDMARGEAVPCPTRTSIQVPLEGGVSYIHDSFKGASRRRGVLAIRMKSDIKGQEMSHGTLRETKWASRPGKFCGLVLLFSTRNGELLAILNDGLIQHLRVGVTSAVGAKYMCRPDAATLGMLGSGGQANSHTRAFAAVLPLKKLKVYSPNPEHRKAFAEEMSRTLGLEAEAVDEPKAAVTGSDLVAVCTNANEPVLKGEWLEPGCHVSAIRSHYALPQDFFSYVDLVVKHQEQNSSRSAVGSEEELRQAYVEEGTSRKRENIPTLEKLVSGQVVGRNSPEQITFFENNAGNGMQFAVAGAVVYERALERGLGRELPTDWFLQDIRD
ncbi:MAG: ornithine cyclodeaminase family protein [Dehalococcoidales bacterium]|nr:ornithine cyclodeaminase family protein [Dehalococcoidales bacterium]